MSDEFLRLLQQHRAAIAAAWRERVIKSYQPEMSRFLSSQSNQFANPVGHSLDQAIRKMTDALIDDESPAAAMAPLDAFLRIRAVQDFSPSQALAFMIELKEVLRAVLREAIDDGPLATELWAFESRIDRLALAAFDVYVDIRDQLTQIRLRERMARDPGPAGAPAYSGSCRTADCSGAGACGAANHREGRG